MRAIFLDQNNFPDYLQGDDFHHLINVARVKKGEKILILNGKGLKSLALVRDIKKNLVELEKIEVTFNPLRDQLHLVLGLPKREATENVLRLSTELGISKIHFFKSEYSQSDLVLNERVKKILISSLLQSNNPYLIQLEKLKSISDLNQMLSQYDKILYFCSHQSLPSDAFISLAEAKRILLIIGPEGGFSPREEGVILNNQSVDVVHLKAHILRTETAVAASVGYVMGKIS